MASLLVSLTTAVVVSLVVVAGDNPEDFDFDFDGLPGVNHEFKVEVAAGARECFYQRMKVDAFLQVAFRVSTSVVSRYTWHSADGRRRS